MAWVWADRVLDTSVTAGTVSLVVSGTPPLGWRTFSVVCAVNDTFYYTIHDPITGAWETGEGTYSALNTIARTTVRQSSNANALVSFAANPKNVFIDVIGYYFGTALPSEYTVPTGAVAYGDATGATGVTGVFADFNWDTTNKRLNLRSDNTGAATFPIHATNNFSTAGTGVGISLDPGGNGVGSRDAQIRATNLTASFQTTLDFLVSNASTPVVALSLAPNLAATFSGALTGTTALFAGGASTPVLRATGNDGGLLGLFNGATKGVQFVASSTQISIEGVDNTGVGSFQPLNLTGSQVTAPTPAAGDSTTKIATTAFVGGAVSATTPPGAIIDFGGFLAPTGWLLCDGALVSRTTYAALFAAVTQTNVTTVTIAAPGVFSWASHPLLLWERVSLETTGALPTGFVVGTNYFVSLIPTSSTFQLAATVGGVSITSSGTQSGVHTIRRNPWGCGNGTTTFGVPDLRGRVTAHPDTQSRVNVVGPTAPGSSGGAGTVALLAAHLASHTHIAPDHLHSAGYGGGHIVSGAANQYGNLGPGGNAVSYSAATGSADRTLTTDGGAGLTGTAHENTQPTMIVNKIIKT